MPVHLHTTIPWKTNKILVELAKSHGTKSRALEKALETQKKLLQSKIKRLENTAIGKKMGVKKQLTLNELPLTDYDFYQQFYNNPTSDAFMYPLENYIRTRTSGTKGKEKWFMIPKVELKKKCSRHFHSIAISTLS